MSLGAARTGAELRQRIAVMLNQQFDQQTE